MSDRTPHATSSYLELGSLLKGRYEILDEIGRGGYSVVYAAQDRELDSNVAIKLLVPPPVDAQVAREQMRREVQAVRGLSHTHIVAVYDYADEGTWSYIVMELVNGPNLAECVRDSGGLAVDEAARIGREVAEALALAHRRGILHRDIKPQNILIDSDGCGRLTDFGSARIAGQTTVNRFGGLVGTVQYVAPEVMKGKRADARSDVYMLGLTLYYTLTARLPENPSLHLPVAPAADGYHPMRVRPDVPKWLDAIIAQATAACPSYRFPTAAAMADALARRAQAAEAKAPAPLEVRDSCFICGAPEPLGLGVCPSCGGTSATIADTLIFVKPRLLQAERKAVAERLSMLLGNRTTAEEVAPVARGYRALVRVAGRGAPSLVEQLALREIPARAVRGRFAWAPLPLGLYLFLGLVGGVGTFAGAIALPSLLIASPLVVALLVALAELRLRQPLVEAKRSRIGLPDQLEGKVVEALQQLGDGTARSLLVDIVRLGGGAYEAARRTGDRADIASHLDHVIAGSCEAATELDELDQSLARLESQRERFPEAIDRWFEIHARAERVRDRLVQRLLEVLTALGRVRTYSAELLTVSGEELSAALRDIEIHFEAHALAAREVEELIGETRSSHRFYE